MIIIIQCHVKYLYFFTFTTYSTYLQSLSMTSTVACPLSVSRTVLFTVGISTTENLSSVSAIVSSRIGILTDCVFSLLLNVMICIRLL